MDMAKKDILLSVGNTDTSFIDEARREARGFSVPQTAWCRANGYRSEKEYKAEMANRGIMMYHTHFCFPSRQKMVSDMAQMGELLQKTGLKLDRFGVSLDPSMAFPPQMRCDTAAHNGLYLPKQADWDEVASFSFSQPHLGDNMIGAPAAYDSCCKALRAGITTMGNVSQFFGWDYPEFTDVEARTRSTIMAIAAMSEHTADGTMIHSNLDDGYGDKCTDMAQFVAMALVEKYIVEDLMGAKLAHSFGDMVHSPYKRLVLLAALKQIHGDGVCGSMVFSNKLGREKKELSWNDAHLCTCMLYDMAGQLHYKTGHAITVMADRGLDDQVTNEELVRKLALGKQLEAYVPEMVKTIDFAGIDAAAAALLARGTRLRDTALAAMGEYIDVKNPYAVMLSIKKLGVQAFLEIAAQGQKKDVLLPTDNNLYSH